MSVLRQDAARASKLFEPMEPLELLRLAPGDVSHPEQRLVQLLGVLRLGPGLLAHASHGSGVERAQRVGRAWLEASTSQYRLGAPLFERGVVEEGVGHGVQDPAGER